jgi:hypothetical protein
MTYFEKLLKSRVRNIVCDQIKDATTREILGKVRSQVWSEIDCRIPNQIHSQVWVQVMDCL